MTPKFILESFGQKGSNCIAIALIKVAILKYGVDKIFRKENRAGQWIITLKNKKILVFTDAEINRINEKNRILFQKSRTKTIQRELRSIRQCVETCFAIMVRNIQVYGYEGREYTESEAKKLLVREGMETGRMHELLGLSRKTSRNHKLVPGHLKLFTRMKAVLLYSDVHIVAMSRGYYDKWGEAVKLERELPMLDGEKAKYWHELK